MTVRSGEILRRFDIDSVYLLRWKRAGVIVAESPGYGTAGGAVWPDWTMRMVWLLRNHITTAGNHHHSSRVMREVSAILAAYPDIDYVVIGDDGQARPAHSPEQVVAMIRQQRTLTTVIAVPPFDEVLAP